MRRDIVHIALTAGGALWLAGCGFADVRSPVPEFMRAKVAEPAVPEPPPDVRRLLGEKPDAVFTAASRPSRIRVSPPIHDPRGGQGWTACVKAEVTSVTGQPLGTRTYRISINAGVISDPRPVDADDTCATETYEPI